MNYLYDVIGFVGAALILFGFYRISIGRWTNKSLWYELDNLLGAIMVIVYQVHHKAYVTVLLNVIWAIVAFRGLIPFVERYQFGKSKRTTHKARR